MPSSEGIGMCGPEFMLCVRIDGREVETTPVALAQMVLDGRVDQRNPSRTSTGAAEQSLEHALNSSYCEALTDELLHRLRAMYVPECSTADLQHLRTRVEALCQWRWTSPHVAARFLWAAGWLNELQDRLESAAGFYDAFLQTPSREGCLRLLAYNNRGVLRIRLGRLEGVQDLARAAVSSGAGAVGPTEAPGLPAACFNLLNLINVSLAADHLARAVDEELVDFFAQVPEGVRTLWLGPESSEETRELCEGRPGRSAGPGPDLLILRDRSCRRLNMLTVRLATCARGLAAHEPLPTMSRLSAGGARLHLWDCRVNGNEPAPKGDAGRASHPPPLVHDRWAEAAGLLLSEDVPASLVRLETPLTRAERFAEEELADVEGQLALNRCELARSRLHVQRRILMSLNRRGHVAGLLARIDAQLERITQIEVHRGHLEYQRACARLVSEVERFCRVTDLCRAERERYDLERRLQEFRTQPSPQAGREVIGLLDELAGRVGQHLRRLRRLEIRRRIHGAWRHIRQSWPADWTTPVPESVYRALAHCHVSDPEGWIQDWPGLEEQLDGHQGHYHLQRALLALQADETAWDRIESEMAQALRFKPDLWLIIAPLFGLSSSSSAAARPEVQAALQTAAERLAAGTLPATDTGDDSGTTMYQAGRLLGRAFRQMDADTRRLMGLWQSAEVTLQPLLASGDERTVERVKALAEQCLDCWPAGHTQVPGRADPRHPVNLFLESCDKARLLVEAERLLSARPPQLEKARGLYADVLRSGLARRDQLRRAATGLYLAEFRAQDTTQVQRQVLTRLEAWVGAMSEEAERCLGHDEVVAEIGRARASLCGGRPPTVKGRGRPDGSEVDGIGYTSRMGGFSSTADGPGTSHSRPEMEHGQPER